MATTLKNILAFTLTSGQTQSIPHGLNIAGTKMVPDECKSSVVDANVVVTADDTNVTVTNNTTGSVQTNVLVEHWHTFERAFAGGVPQTTLSPQPFIDGANGSSGAGSVGIRMQDTPIATVNVYVDGVNGLDTNSGLSAITALKTLQAVYDKFPWWYMNGAQLQVNVAGVGGFGANATARLDYDQAAFWLGGGALIQPNITFVGPEMVPVALATGTNAPTLNVTPTTIVGQTDGADATAGRTRVLCNAPGWTAHDMRTKKCFARFLRAGVKVIWETPVSDNGVDRLWLDTPIAPGVILATDTLQIVQPGVRATGSTFNFSFVSIFGRGAGFAPFAIPANFVRFGFTDVLVSGADGASFDRCNASSWSVQGGTHFFAQCKASTFTLSNCTFSGIFTLGDPVAGPINTTQRVTAVTSDGSGFQIGFAAVNPLGPIAAYHSSISGITTRGPAAVDLSNGVAGDSNGAVGTGYGMWSRVGGGQIQCSGGTRATITGANGDIAIDIMPAALVVPYGAGAGGYEEAIGFNGNAFRVPVLASGGFGRVYTLA